MYLDLIIFILDKIIIILYIFYYIYHVYAYAGTIEGALGLLIPIEERTYRRLVLLQQIMSTSISTTCCLNPREFRVMKTSKPYLLEKKRGILDGNLLYKFVTLDPSTQIELTAAMGTTVDIVMDNLLEIDVNNTFI